MERILETPFASISRGKGMLIVDKEGDVSIAKLISETFPTMEVANQSDVTFAEGCIASFEYQLDLIREWLVIAKGKDSAKNDNQT